MAGSSPRPANHNTFYDSIYGITSPILYIFLIVGLCVPFSWPLHWLLSGAPLLEALLLLGSQSGYRILSSVPLWPLASTLDVLYCICSTSWLLYYVFAIGCYGLLPIVCLFQFGGAADWARRQLRRVLISKGLHFIDDKIGFFDIPGMEIDTEVDGLMVFRGITLSISSLSIKVHGVEVGIKMTKDLELGIACEEAVVRLFRGIDVGDCYARIKGGEREISLKVEDDDMAKTNGSDSKRNADRGSILEVDSKMLRAADRKKFYTQTTAGMSDRQAQEHQEMKEAMENITRISPDESKEAREKYEKTLKWIYDTNSIQRCRIQVQRKADFDKAKTQSGTETMNEDSTNDMRAAICSQLQHEPSITYPPRRSIKVTTIQTLPPPHIRSFLHRLPMLLRLLLNIISYLHPVHISSITTTASGSWIKSLLVAKMLSSSQPSSPASPKSVSDPDSDSDTTMPKVHARVQAWLNDANFALCLTNITGLAQVPLTSTSDIHALLSFDDVMAYRTMLTEFLLKQVVRLGGADATFTLPMFLLPHHEHLLPDRPTLSEMGELEKEVLEAEGKPKTLRLERERQLKEKDECVVKLSAHVRLPALFDQELLDWVAALVKASKITEMEKEPSVMDAEVHGFRDFMGAVGGGMKESMKKTVVSNVMNDKWIAKMVGKITKKLEEGRGDAGYAGDIPVPLGKYRLSTEARERGEGDKILP